MAVDVVIIAAALIVRNRTLISFMPSSDIPSSDPKGNPDSSASGRYLFPELIPKPVHTSESHTYRRYADIALAIPTQKTYLYGIPDSWDAMPAVGARAYASRGGALVSGFVLSTGGPELPESQGLPFDKIKPLVAVQNDGDPILPASLIALGGFIAEYYICGIGEALDAMLPRGVKSGAGGATDKYVIPAVDAAILLQQADAIAATAPKQASLIRTLAALPPPVRYAELLGLAAAKASSLKTLEKKGLIAVVEKPPFDPQLTPAPEASKRYNLSGAQRAAVGEIGKAIRLNEYRAFLLEGVTGSGKTEVYLHALDICVQAGRSAIILVPEISLTPQTVSRFRARFDRIAVLHSHLTDGQRADEWRRIAAGGVDVVIGARSAIFAPLDNIGLIIVDEEHETSYKQETVPRYNARDIAVYRASRSAAAVVLGSAKPSIETRHPALNGKYSFLRLPDRVTGHTLPVACVLNLTGRTQISERERAGLTDEAVDAFRKTLAAGRQAIVFLNRRGHNSALKCPRCGWVDDCPSCSIARTFHKKKNLLLCHYCGSSRPVVKSCPACGNPKLFQLGTGTERIEQALLAEFPSARIARMDSDTMTERGSYSLTLTEFRLGRIDALVGTQMIAKGLDFPNVTLVIIVNADATLEFPDFRASERTFQLISQVSGRAGRGDQPGQVLIQTTRPDYPAIRFAAAHDYESFYRFEVKAREPYAYPPFGRLAQIFWRSASLKEATERSEMVTHLLRERAATFAHRLIIKGPVECPIARINDLHRRHALVISPDGGRPLSAFLNESRDILASTHAVYTGIDVDAINML